MFISNFFIVNLFSLAYTIDRMSFSKGNKSYDETDFNDSRNCHKSEEGQGKYVLCPVLFLYNCELLPFYNAAFMYNYTNITESLLLTLVYDLLPSKTQPLIISIINEIYHSSSFTLLSVTAVSAIWAAGKGFVSIIQGLNDVYDTGGESRNYFVLRFHAMLYTIALIVIIIYSEIVC